MPGEEIGAVSAVVGFIAGTRELCIGMGRGELMGSAVEGGRGPLIKVDEEIDIPVTVSVCRLKMTVPVMTKLRSLRVMWTRRRRKKILRKMPKR